MEQYKHTKIVTFEEILQEELGKEELTTKDAYWVIGHGKEIADVVSKSPENLARVEDGQGFILPGMQAITGDATYLDLGQRHYCCSVGRDFREGLTLATTYAKSEAQLRDEFAEAEKALKNADPISDGYYFGSLADKVVRIGRKLKQTDDRNPLEQYTPLDLQGKIAVITSPGSIFAKDDLSAQPINLGQVVQDERDNCFNNRMKVFNYLIENGASSVVGLAKDALVTVKPYDAENVIIKQYNV